MTENMKKFLQAISANAELQDRVNKMTKEELLDEAAKLGIALTDEDFKQEESQGSLSDDELGAVSGGLRPCGCVTIGVGHFRRGSL